jgi:hypothetical protein
MRSSRRLDGPGLGDVMMQTPPATPSTRRCRSFEEDNVALYCRSRPPSYSSCSSSTSLFDRHALPFDAVSLSKQLLHRTFGSLERILITPAPTLDRARARARSLRAGAQPHKLKRRSAQPWSTSLVSHSSWISPTAVATFGSTSRCSWRCGFLSLAAPEGTHSPTPHKSARVLCESLRSRLTLSLPQSAHHISLSSTRRAGPLRDNYLTLLPSLWAL